MKHLEHQWVIDLPVSESPATTFIGGRRIRCGARGILYLTDPVTGSILKLDRNGRLIHRAIADEGGFRQPRDIATTARGEMLIADWGSGTDARVVRLDRDAQLRRTFSLDAPADAIAVDSSGAIYLHHPRSPSRIHKYTKAGKLVAAFGDRPKGGALPLKQGTARLYEPFSSLAVDGRSNVYFAPAWTYVIARYDSSGRRRGQLRRSMRGTKQLATDASGAEHVLRELVIRDIAIMRPRNDVYVLRGRSANHCAVVDRWTSRGRLSGELYLDHIGQSIACDGRGGLYLLDGNVSLGSVKLLKYVDV